MFNIDDEGSLVLRKASAHGLGHLLDPYDETDSPSSIPQPSVALKEIGVRRWQHDVWYRIVEAALADRPDQPDLDLPGFDKPALSRYAATTPDLLRWFKGYNEGRTYCDQVRPFGFMQAAQADTATSGRVTRQGRVKVPKPVATGYGDLEPFDRESGNLVPLESLKTYRQGLAQYHLHPEGKFLGGDYLDRGLTERWHVLVASIRHIGKEANKLEVQQFLGIDDAAHIDYGLSLAQMTTENVTLRAEAERTSVAAVARWLGFSRQFVWNRLKKYPRQQ